MKKNEHFINALRIQVLTRFARMFRENVAETADVFLRQLNRYNNKTFKKYLSTVSSFLNVIKKRHMTEE